VDGLYWSFIEDHRDFFESNPRSKMVVGTLVRMGSERKKRIFAAAEDFIDRVTD
jgi:deoxyribodipyrimidine photolyase-related protein